VAGPRSSTRFTSSLTVYGDLTISGDKLKLQEIGGIRIQPITVLLPGGEEVPVQLLRKELLLTARRARRSAPH